MADRKGGPVKPPTLDLKAREKAAESEKAAPRAAASSSTRTRRTGTAAGGKPDPATSAAANPPKADTTKTPENAPTSGPVLPWLPLGGGLLLGLFGGGVAAWALLASGLIAPQPVTPADPGASARAALEARLAPLEGEAAELKATLVAVRAAQEDSRSALETRLAAVEQSAGDLDAAIAALPAPDPALSEDAAARLVALESAATDLGARIDVLAAGVPDGAGVAPEALAGVRESVAGLATRIEATEAALAQVSEAGAGQAETLAALGGRAEALETALGEVRAVAAQPLPVAEAGLLRLPLAFAGYEAALRTGAPFAGELQTIGNTLAGLRIDPALTEAAIVGVETPAHLLDGFAALVPAMLAARPTDPDADWLTAAAERLKALIALRPVDGATGQTPEALVARAEARLRTGDLTGAQAAIAALPAPMVAAAGDWPDRLAMSVAAADLLAAARARALDETEAGQ